MHTIMSHAHGQQAQMKLAERKLDNLGFMSGACGVQNDPRRLARLKAQLGLAASLAEITREGDDAKAQTKSLKSTELIESSKAALHKYAEKVAATGSLAAKDLTKKELCAIASTYYQPHRPPS